MKTLVAKLWRNEFYKGTVFLILSSFAGNILNYFFNFLAARTLGPAGYGEITALFSYIFICTVPVTVITTIIIRKIGSEHEKQYELTQSLETYFISTIKKVTLPLLLSLVIVPFLPRITNLSSLTAYALVPMVFLTLFSSFYSASLQGLRLFGIFSIITTTAVLIKLMGAIPFINHHSYAVVLTFLILSTAVSTVWMYVKIHSLFKKNTNRTIPTIDTKLRSVISSKQFIITTLSIAALTLLNNADIIFVKKFFVAHDAGIYSSWSLFAKIILYAVAPITTVSLVFFSSKKHEQSHVRTLSLSLITLGVIGIASFLFYNFFAGRIIFLLFGTQFYQVESSLTIASIFGTLYAALTFLNNFFLAKKSNAALILPCSIPFYFFLLWQSHTRLNDIYTVNVLFSATVTGLYLISFLKMRKS